MAATPSRLEGQRETDGSDRIHQLDGLRALAFLCVFLHHSVQARLMWWGVDLFFVLSGFLITTILLRQRQEPGYFRSFYGRRLLRIFPPYYLFLLVNHLVTDTPWSELKWFVVYLNNFRSAVDAVPTGRGLTPMWSLAVEEQFYVVWPVVVLLLSPRRLWQVSVGLVLLAPVLRGAVTTVSADFKAVYCSSFTRMDLLAAGALLALLWTREPDVFRRYARFGLVLCTACLVTLLAAALVIGPSFRTTANSVVFNVVAYSLVLGMMVGLVAYCVAQRNGAVVSVLRWPPLVYLGTISYTMYLYHVLVLDVIVPQRALAPAPRALLSLAIVVAWSAASWHLFEKPVARLKGRWFPSCATGVASAGPRLNGTSFDGPSKDEDLRGS